MSDLDQARAAFSFAPGLWHILPELAKRAEELYSEPEEIAQLVGSPAWVRQQQYEADRDRRTYSAVGSLKRAYRTLPSEVRSVNVSMDTVLGKQLSPSLINAIELTIALYLLTERQRDAWLLEVQGVPRERIAEALEASTHAVAQLVSVAGRALIERIFDPDLVVSISLGVGDG